MKSTKGPVELVPRMQPFSRRPSPGESCSCLARRAAQAGKQRWLPHRALLRLPDPVAFLGLTVLLLATGSSLQETLTLLPVEGRAADASMAERGSGANISPKRPLLEEGH